MIKSSVWSILDDVVDIVDVVFSMSEIIAGSNFIFSTADALCDTLLHLHQLHLQKHVA